MSRCSLLFHFPVTIFHFSPILIHHSSLFNLQPSGLSRRSSQTCVELVLLAPSSLPSATMLAVRPFSTSVARRSVLDYFKFFKKKTPSSATESTTVAERDTKEVIKDVETSQDTLPVADKVEILGRKNPRYTDKAIIAENLNGFAVNRWIPRRTAFTDSLTSDNYATQISAKLTELFRASSIDVAQPIVSLSDKLALFKAIQQTFTIYIPDSKFTLLNTYEDFNVYLVQHMDPQLKLSNKNEFKPDAVDFAPGAFEGTNVYTGKWTFNSQKEKNYKKLLKKASKLEKQSIQEYKQQ